MSKKTSIKKEFEIRRDYYTNKMNLKDLAQKYKLSITTIRQRIIKNLDKYPTKRNCNRCKWFLVKRNTVLECIQGIYFPTKIEINKHYETYCLGDENYKNCEYYKNEL